MKISIIIPVYNVSEYIVSCLESVFKQKYSNYEVILIDDCGNDDSIKLAENTIKKFRKEDITTIIRHEKNKGLSAARNSGVKKANGDYILFLDSDDELCIDALNKFYAVYMNNRNCDFYIGQYLINNTTNTDYKYLPLSLNTKLSNNQEIYSSYINENWYVMACGKFINKVFFKKNELWFPEGYLHEDMLFSYKLATVANTASIIFDNIYVYNIRNNSITTNKKEKNYLDMLWIIREAYMFSVNKNNHNPTYFLSLLFGTTVSISKSSLSTNSKIAIIRECKKLSFNIIKYKNIPFIGKVKKTIYYLNSYIIYLILRIL